MSKVGSFLWILFQRIKIKRSTKTNKLKMHRNSEEEPSSSLGVLKFFAVILMFALTYISGLLPYKWYYFIKIFIFKKKIKNFKATIPDKLQIFVLCECFCWGAIYFDGFCPSITGSIPSFQLQSRCRKHSKIINIRFEIWWEWQNCWNR